METTVEQMANAVNDLANEPDETPEPSGEQAPPTPPSEIEIDGEKFTLDQVKAWKAGTMMEADYRQKTADLARIREASESSRRVMEQLAEEYKKAIAVSGRETKDDEIELSPAMKRVIDDLRAKQKALDDSLKQRHEAEQAERTDAFILDTTDSILSEAMKATKGTDGKPLFDESDLGVIRHYIAGRNPDLYDPITGQLSRESIKAAITREFSAFKTAVERWQKKNTSETINNLKREPPKKPGLRAASPGKPAGNGKEKPWEWDTASAIDAVLERASSKGPAAEY